MLIAQYIVAKLNPIITLMCIGNQNEEVNVPKAYRKASIGWNANPLYGVISNDLWWYLCKS